MPLTFPEQFRVHGVEAVFRQAGIDMTGKDAVYAIPVRSRTTGVAKARLCVLLCLVSSGDGWEHVSITVRDQHLRQQPRTPLWSEMELVKQFFWTPDDAVIEAHPPDNEHVNLAKGCLHLWRPVGGFVKGTLPPCILVGGTVQDRNVRGEESVDGEANNNPSEKGFAGTDGK